MLVPFEQLPEASRVWIYQCNRTLSTDEISIVNDELKTFLTQWTAHGAQLNAGYDLPYSRFIVLALDQSESGASGCSIDASVRFIQHLEQRFNVDLLDKMNVSYKQGEFVAYKTLLDFKKMAKDKAVSKSTIVFNNLVNNIAEYKSNWEVPAEESWHSRFMSKS